MCTATSYQQTAEDVATEGSEVDDEADASDVVTEEEDFGPKRLQKTRHRIAKTSAMLHRRNTYVPELARALTHVCR